MEVALDTPYPLAPDASARFARAGYVRLPDLFDAPTLGAHRALFSRLVAEDRRPVRPLEERDTYGRAFRQVLNLWRRDPVARAFVFSQRLAGVAAALLGVRGVRLYHDQALFKEPGGGRTPWHADQYYWPLASDRAVTAWVPLQAVSPEMGPLAFSPGSHTRDIGRDLAISDESEAMIGAAMAGAPVDEAPFALGEVSFHAGWTFHRAGANATSVMRGAMTVIYIDADMRLAEPKNKAQAVDAQVWCRDVSVGEVIAGPLNPVLFSR